MKHSIVMTLLLSGLACGLATAAAAAAEPPMMEPTQVVSAFHAALSAGKSDEALSLLSPEVVIFESGGAEMTRAEYGSHHLAGDIEFVRTVATTVVDEQSGQSGEAAWVLRRTSTTGKFRGKEINSRGTETMILRKTEAGWRIAHIHWSSHSPK